MIGHMTVPIVTGHLAYPAYSLKFDSLIHIFTKISSVSLIMSNPIWNIDLFIKISKEQAECNDYKKAGRTKYVFELAHASVKSLVTHMNTKLHADEFLRELSSTCEATKAIIIVK
jgi:hypothetical protein